MKKTPTPTKRNATKKPTLAATIAKMQKQEPALTKKVDAVLNKIAKLELAVRKHEQAENQLKDLIINSGFVEQYVDYTWAKRDEDRHA